MAAPLGHRLRASLVILALLTLAPVEASATVDPAELLRRQVTRLLTTAQAEPLGSAVVIGAEAGGQWLVTSRHVVESIARVCVVASDGTAAAAQVLPFRELASRLALDVAILWQPAHQHSAAVPTQQVVAPWAKPMPVPADFPLVVATGYPSPTQVSGEDRPQPLRYQESTGLLLPLLQAPIEGGFDLSSTVSVSKGMSGGGLFLGDQLVGINSTHAHPLWSGVLLNKAGTPIDPLLNSRLEQVSLGVSSTTIQNLLQATKKPPPHILIGIENLRCSSTLQSPAR